MSTVKRIEKEPKDLKVVSKILYLIGRIGAILTMVAFVFTVIAMIVIPFGLAKIEVKDNNLVYEKSILKVEEVKGGVEIVLKDNDKVKLSKLNNKDVEEFKKVITERKTSVTIALFEIGFALVLVSLYLIFKICKYLEKLFLNIHDGDNPFSLDNVNYIKKMAYYMIACLFVPAIGEAFLSAAAVRDVELGIDMFDAIEIVFLYAVALIFEQGYKMQNSTKPKKTTKKAK